jgi:hypothetical protein
VLEVGVSRQANVGTEEKEVSHHITLV